MLIEKGADPNAHDDRGGTPLHVAASKGHTDLARMLIENGTDLNAIDSRRQTPLDMANLNRHITLVMMLQNAAKDQPGHADSVAS